MTPDDEDLKAGLEMAKEAQRRADAAPTAKKRAPAPKTAPKAAKAPAAKKPASKRASAPKSTPKSASQARPKASPKAPAKAQDRWEERVAAWRESGVRTQAASIELGRAAVTAAFALGRRNLEFQRHLTLKSLAASRALTPAARAPR